MIPKQNALYQACYCEENVYKLIEMSEDREGVFAVFISNEHNTTPLWSQLCASRPGGYVAWDYHVIALQKSAKEGVRVYDLDSNLEWGVDFKVWWEKTMNEEHELSKRFPREFRLIDAEVYLNLLCSDRNHMLNTDGTYLAPPPSWRCIRPEHPSNVKLLANMSEEIKNTVVFNERAMKQLFTIKK